MKDPERLSEGQGDLADLLRAARADLPATAELSGVAAALSKLPPVVAGAAAGGSGAAAAVGVGGGKVVGVLVVACGLVAASIYGLIKTSPPPLSAATPIVSQSPVASGSARATPSAEHAPGPAPVASSADTSELTPAAPLAKTKTQTESQLLDAARAALSSDPNRALALTRRHAQLFPTGVLAQEREVIAIEALKRQGKGGAAQQRADTFQRNYPNSPHKTKVDELQPPKP